LIAKDLGAEAGWARFVKLAPAPIISLIGLILYLIFADDLVVDIIIYIFHITFLKTSNQHIPTESLD
jgi:hypothetical protein